MYQGTWVSLVKYLISTYVNPGWHSVWETKVMYKPDNKLYHCRSHYGVAY